MSHSGTLTQVTYQFIIELEKYSIVSIFEVAISRLASKYKVARYRPCWLIYIY